MGIKIGGQIDKVNGKELCYSDFVRRYMDKNQPVVLTNLMDDWRAYREWVTENGKPNLQFFSTHFGKSRVQVADCGTRELTDQKRVEMSVSELVEQWLKDSIEDGSNDLTQEIKDRPVLYLKDWHFVKAIWLECIQEPNEIIFVPSGWYHQVHNLEETISINHNWFNAYNLSWVWDLLLKDYNEAKEYIEDIKDICDDFEGLCQRNLAANTGMNFVDFFIFLTRMCFANLVQVCYLLIDEKNNKNPTRSLSPIARHLTSNLLSIQKVVSKMTSVEGNPGIRLDFRESLNDSKFLKLCMALEDTYGAIHEQQKHDCHAEATLVNDIKDLDIIRTHSCQVSTPEDLVKFLEHVLTKLGGSSKSNGTQES
ncbi:hypothetical protein UlMin_044532 [Ulmus minor]